MSTVLAVAVSLWFLVALAAALFVAYLCWLGMSNDEIWDALPEGGDAGQGVPGMSP